MTKKELVKSISEEIGLTQLRTMEIVQKTFDAIIDTLSTEGRIELRNFGVFEVKKRKARRARNPRNGDQVEVPEKYVVTFRPGKEMEAKVAELLQKNREQTESISQPGHPPVAESPIEERTVPAPTIDSPGNVNRTREPR